MTFRDNARLDPSQVQDRRGGSRIGGPAVIGGGAGGILLLIIYMLLGGNPGDLGGLGGTGGGELAPENSALAAECRTGADANARDDCRIVGYVNSVQGYWTTAFANSGQTYQPADTRFFDAPIATGCGTAGPEVGPFYCPTDRYVYIDLGFFQQLRD